jgi:hypothetical protein
MIKETTPSPDVRLGSVLAILTSRFAGPALILVTAATEEDDTRLLATSIAQLVHSTGKRAAYVSLVSPALVLEDRTSGPYAVLRPSASTLSTPAAFDNAAAQWREQYDFVFLDAPTLLATPLVPHVARKANGVLIALRRGRAASSGDSDAATILKHVGAFTIGIVTTPARPVRVGSSAARSTDSPLPKFTNTDLRAQPVET